MYALNYIRCGVSDTCLLQWQVLLSGTPNNPSEDSRRAGNEKLPCHVDPRDVAAASVPGPVM